MAQFISYAQNFEDVILYRALKHIDKGFYIDVGAAWPDEHSVTKAFYEKGWQGINIEPNPEFNTLLQQKRTRDINLAKALGDKPGRLCLSLIKGSGLSTLDTKIAQKHIETGWDVTHHEVEITTLASIWSEFVPEEQDVHFLKVDVEGFEMHVLLGNDWEKYRPWIVVIEATLPCTPKEAFIDWEPILLKADYLFAYADGLNRFYVAKDHAELLSAFKYPPNVFDDFVLIEQKTSETRIINLLEEIRQKEKQISALDKEIRQKEKHINAFENSLSWRITAPLRGLKQLTVRLLLLSFRTIKIPVRPIAIRLIRFVLNRPAMRERLSNRLRAYPRLFARLRQFAHRNLHTGPAALQPPPPKELAHLTPRARQIYHDLKAAIEKNREQRDAHCN